VKEVILSGGDPLTLSDRELALIAADLAASPHLRRWRIHTRAPIVEPGRVTAALTRLLGNGLPLRVVLHANHPAELVPEARRALRTLRAGGVELANQAVLLRGVNDHPRILLELLGHLTEEGVEPYYLHHPDRARGNSRFRVSIRQGRQIYRALVSNAETNGQQLRVPPYVLDLPNGCGKSPAENLRPVCTERSSESIRTRYRWHRPADWDSAVAADTSEWWDIWEAASPDSRCRLDP
jgi:lysine 2,3-aminomutase